MPTAFRRAPTDDPSHPDVLRRTDWLSGPDNVVLARLAPLRWDPVRDDKTMRSALKSAIDGHRTPVVVALLNAGVPVNTVLREEHRDVSALRVALGHRNPEMVRTLLEHGARLTEQEAQARPAALWLLGQKARTKGGSPERKRAREAQIVDLLVAHGLAQRPDPVIARRLPTFSGASPTKLLPALLDHGLLTTDPDADGPDLLRDALAVGQATLVHPMIEHGFRPDPARPQALDDLVLAAAGHRAKGRDVPGRRQHRALGLIERLADLGPDHDLPGAIGRCLANPSWSTASPRSSGPTTPPAPSRTPTPTGPDDPASDAHRVLRLAAAGVWPSRWWAALRALDLPAVEHLLQTEHGACAHWVDEHNRGALHVLLHELHPVGPFEGPLDDGLDRDALTALQARSAHPTADPAQILGIAQRLLAHGLHPLWGSGGMAGPGLDHPTGALWSALDLPGPLGEALSVAMLNALTPDDQEPLIARAVQDRRSRLTLDRLIAHGLPLDSLWNGDGALHLTVKVPACHDRLPALLAHGAQVDRRNAHGDTPRDLAASLLSRYQGQDSARVAYYQALIHRLDVVLLEQAVQDVLPPDGVPSVPVRPRL